MDMTKLSRIMLKVSGEGLMGDKPSGHNYKIISQIANDIKAVVEMGIQVCLITGGGNIHRGLNNKKGTQRVASDHMGMLATAINALALQNALEDVEVESRVMSAIPMNTVCEPYIRRKAVRHLEKSRVVVFAAGTGNPFFTTDTAAALRAVEMGCNVIMKATQVDGVYSADPKVDSNAKMFDKISYKDLIHNDLKIMDTSAISLARDNGIPILVFNLHKPSAMLSVLNGKGNYTIISE